jgi:hypothetical protein
LRPCSSAGLEALSEYDAECGAALLMNLSLLPQGKSVAERMLKPEGVLGDSGDSEAGPYMLHSMTKCVKVLRAKAKAESMDQSQARTGSKRFFSEPVIGPCILLLLSLVTL